MIRSTLVLLGTLALFAWARPVQAQPGNPDEQLAAQYFQQGDHEKAALYYAKLYKGQPTPYYYEQLYKCYTALRAYDEAEKLVKEQIRRSDDEPRYMVDLGALMKLQDQTAKAEQQYDKAIKALKADQNAVRQLANAFTRVNEYDRALATYEKGRKIINNAGFSFDYEIANLHALRGDMPRMISSYLDLIGGNPAYLQSVQNALARYIDFSSTDSRTELLRTELLRRIQKDPQNTLYPDMLIWVYLQQGDLEGAFVQSRAMDKRFNEGGERMMELAGMALTNKNWDIATRCYQYVIALGADNQNHLAARLGLVEAMDKRITASSAPALADLQALEREYTSVLSELGASPGTATLVAGLAHLKAYYLNDRPGAIMLLEELTNMPGLDKKKQAGYKLDLGDVYVLGGDIWEASLLYSQVDLEYKQDMLGHEARLRNAKVSFHAGDFLWAKAQLDVLKNSTSKLIANDAMELSLLITDNLGTDSVSPPLSFFARAQLLTFQHRYDEAVAVLDSLDTTFPMSALADDVLYQRYRIAYARHQYEQAAGFLEKVVELYPNEILVDNAMYDLGRLQELDLKDKEKAKAWYEKLMFEQPGSIFAPDARLRFRHLRGDHDNLDTPEQRFLNGSTP